MPNRASEPALVRADFTVPVDYPISKGKFAVYNSGLVPLERYERDSERFKEVGPASLRVDLAWGWPPEWDAYRVQPVTGTAERLSFNFDERATLLNAVGVSPYWSYCYMPRPLQLAGDWRSVPTSVKAWGHVLGAFAAHYRARGIRVGYHEVYNEPDLIDHKLGPHLLHRYT